LKRVLVTHAYSAENLGDGLLVAETLELVASTFAPEQVEVTVLASYPDSFPPLPGVTYVGSKPGRLGYSGKYLRVLAEIGSFDAIVAVGGGYLRAKTMREALKTLLVHGPQLVASALLAPGRSIYLPQSVGPANFGSRPLFRYLLRRMGTVFLRDDRSVREMRLENAVRLADLAAGRMGDRTGRTDVDDTPVLSVRHVRGSLSDDVVALAAKLGLYDSYIQSTVRSNDDRPATAELSYRQIISRDELLQDGSAPRVVVAVRLHAALMALAAGHFVVHLAYERKGFGAFGDLGLEQFVHNVNAFDVDAVYTQVRALLTDAAARMDYEDRIRNSLSGVAQERDTLGQVIRRHAR